MRRLLAAVLPLVVLAAPGASAAPSLSAQHGAQVAFVLTSGARTYVVTLLASQPVQGGAPQLRVHLGTQSETVRTLYGELPAKAFTDPSGSPVLRTTVGGVPLQVRWHPEAASAGLSGHSWFTGESTDVEGWAVNGFSGSADVVLGSVRCATPHVVVGPASVAGGASFGQPLRTGLHVPLKGARCGSMPSLPLPPPLP